MNQEIVDKKEILSIAAQLTNDNKRYVIAVANALLFTQRQGNDKKQACRTVSECAG